MITNQRYNDFTSFEKGGRQRNNFERNRGDDDDAKPITDCVHEHQLFCGF